MIYVAYALGAYLAFILWLVYLGPFQVVYSPLVAPLIRAAGMAYMCLGRFCCTREPGMLCEGISKKHERRHHWQWLLLGPLFLPLYFLCAGVLWVYGKVTRQGPDFAWRKNPFEQDARRAAGQAER